MLGVFNQLLAMLAMSSPPLAQVRKADLFNIGLILIGLR